MGVTGVKIELDRPRTLRFDHNALADLDAELIRSLGKSMFSIFMDLKEEEDVPYELVGFAGTRLLLWSGLKGEDTRLTVSAAGNLIGEYKDGLDGLMPIIWKALTDSGALGDLIGKPDPTKPPVQKMPTA